MISLQHFVILFVISELFVIFYEKGENALNGNIELPIKPVK